MVLFAFTFYSYLLNYFYWGAFFLYWGAICCIFIIMVFFSLGMGAFFWACPTAQKNFVNAHISTKRKKTNREKRSHKEKNAPFFHVIRLSGTLFQI